MRQVTDDERFWSKVKVGHPLECWEWQAATNGRYGLFWIGRHTKAHRYVMGVGLGDPVVVMHRCDNTVCVNPAHLRIGTQIENMADMVAKGRAGRSQGEDHYATTLTADDVRAIRASTDSHAVLAATYGVGKSTIGAIIRRQNWAWLD